jgi:copper chaperone CopZ
MQAKMKIEGMHCGSCAAEIRDTLAEHAGVESAAVDYNGKTAIVDFDQNTIQPQTLIKLIQDIGYNASLSTTE